MERFFSIKSMVFLLLLVIFTFRTTTSYGREPDSHDYIVGPGDTLQIEVWDHEDLTRSITVSQDGSFTFPFVGKINAADQSVSDIEELLTRKLGDGYLVAPQITVSVSEYNNKKIFLFGEVLRPGSYPLRRDMRLLEMVSEAGGFTSNRGSTCHIVRTKKTTKAAAPVPIESAAANEIITIDLNRLTSGEFRENIKLFPGDSIYINTSDHVFVTGEVNRPGEVKWINGMTVRQAIAIAGGGTPRAATNRTSVVRMQNNREIEVKPGLSDPVFPNDVIKVPESYF